ncbi:hypothetical protein OU800_07710 [Pseudomonas sp. GOM7]|uniref:hypothetical protein n=1 Tax=Pseudomonas sp. GOM7 TaxID=2998079 RepID=UPI00227AB703|nr:hypothetical protein [Pseudomonas sp. GOM7]WAJ39104.1 hypothetical protein OU800_07710 [Pseudomonas sp. GOM7]
MSHILSSRQELIAIHPAISLRLSVILSSCRQSSLLSVKPNDRGEQQMDEYQEELLERDAFDQDVLDTDDATEL